MEISYDLSKNLKVVVGLLPFLTIVVGVIIYIVGYFIKKHTKSYFDNHIKDELQKMFNGYKHEIYEHLKDLKDFKEFKESKILIINDKNRSIDKMTLLANFINKDVKDLHEIENIKKKDIERYSMIIIDNDDERINQNLEKWKNLIEKVPNHTPIIIYATENKLESNELFIFKNKLFTPVNSNFTLIEKLYNAFLIRKVMEDKK
ncbi:hypothetical protein [Persephonella sp. KM09-Lau-8]|uniref:hypothetical protein n=1 Tax=Persephonella sp. KM09-Lau-8 TaxID=1158345 RepID=UPI000496A9D2|nr:hypothetical protein [Persephonella sp. KM09-Lau-8]